MYELYIIIGLLIAVLIGILYRELENPPPPGAASVSGKVTNANNKPDDTVEGVTITLTQIVDPTVAFSVSTGADGSYSFASVPNGDYMLDAFLADPDGSTLNGSTQITVAGVPLVVPDLPLVSIIIPQIVDK